jgi:hypothetical protein
VKEFFKYRKDLEVCHTLGDHINIPSPDASTQDKIQERLEHFTIAEQYRHQSRWIHNQSIIEQQQQSFSMLGTNEKAS